MIRSSMLPSIAFLLLILPGCSGSTQHGQSFKLPSGHVIRVIGIMPLHYMNGNPPSLMFQYETDLLVSDKNELIKEVDEIWSVLRIDAERDNFNSAIVSAREVPHGFIFKNAKGFNFVYKKHLDGSWHRMN